MYDDRPTRTLAVPKLIFNVPMFKTTLKVDLYLVARLETTIVLGWCLLVRCGMVCTSVNEIISQNSNA